MMDTLACHKHLVAVFMHDSFPALSRPGVSGLSSRLKQVQILSSPSRKVSICRFACCMSTIGE
jgi:hypothetical protein